MRALPVLALAVTLGGGFAMSTALASTQLHVKSGCVACHTVDKKLVGPAYKDIAQKYKGRADAVAYLSQRVRKGGPGNWGSTPMAANDVKKLNDAELKALVTWILATP